MFKLFFVVELDIRAANFKKKRGEVVGRNLPCNLTKLINIWFASCVICGSGDAAWPARSSDSSASEFLLHSYLKTRSSPTKFCRSKTENLRNRQALSESVAWWEISCQGDRSVWTWVKVTLKTLSSKTACSRISLYASRLYLYDVFNTVNKFTVFGIIIAPFCFRCKKSSFNHCKTFGISFFTVSPCILIH